ncbi:MAG: helix-turn-helix transcriptional regulator [Candidatus Sulfotelmatobacter sp.]
MRDDGILKAFGKQLRDLREEKGLSQEKLAELAGVHRTYQGLIERGRANPTLLAIVALARALKVRPAKLLEKLR